MAQHLLEGYVEEQPQEEVCGRRKQKLKIEMELSRTQRELRDPQDNS